MISITLPVIVFSVYGFQYMGACGRYVTALDSKPLYLDVKLMGKLRPPVMK